MKYPVSIRTSAGRWTTQLLAMMLLTTLLAQTTYGQAPNRPTDVRLDVVRSDAIDVFWTDNSDNENAFDIFRQDAGGSFRLIGAVDANLTQFQDRNSGITSNVQYCYRVSARNSAGSSPPSEVVCVRVPTRPNAPNRLRVARDDDDSPIRLVWEDNSDDESGFLIYRDIETGAFSLFDTVGTNVLAYNDRIVRSDGTYCYFVSAFNPAGESTASATECVDVSVGAPNLPESFQAQAATGTTLDVVWSFDLISYRTLILERRLGTSDVWVEILRTTDLVTSVTDDNLSPNTEYCYRMALESVAGLRDTTEVVCATTEFTRPDPPAEFSASGLEDRSISLSWSGTETAEVTYLVERSVNDGAFQRIADAVESPPFVNTDLVDNAVYCYRIAAFNPQFTSDFSQVSCAIVAPSRVTDLSVEPNAEAPTSSLDVSWSRGTGTVADGFEVRFRPEGGPFSAVSFVSAAQLVIQVPDDGVRYDVDVTSVRSLDTLRARSSPVIGSAATFLSFWPGDINDDGFVSADDAVRLTSDACLAQTTSFSTDGSDVAWSERAIPIDGEDPAILRCDTDRTGVVDIFDFLAIAANAGRNTGKRGQITPEFVTSETHRARLAQLTNNFNPDPDRPAQLQLKADLLAKLTGDLDLPDELSLSAVFPNPTGGRASLVLSLPHEAADLDVTMYDMSGRKVRTILSEGSRAGRHPVEFETSDLAPGVYFVVVEVDGSRMVRPVTVLN